ncbi:cytochrome P450 [Xylariomycetidae sp. FL2044]|nr:cytochrome P450 [Xylariomycetidae sp. FL2044]
MTSDILPKSWLLSPLATAIVTFIMLYAISYGFSAKKIHAREPTVIAPTIPLIGHLLGMVLLGGKYIKGLGLKNKNLPIFTMPVPNSRIYIVTDPSLAAAVQRASRALSFTPIIPEVTERVLGLDQETMEITRKNLDPGPGDPRGFLADIQDMTYSWFGPGDYLTEITLAAAREMKEEVGSYVKSLDAISNAARLVDLLDWVRHFVTISTAKYLYGPENPITQDPSLEAAFWDFDHGLGSLLMNIFPSITARKAYMGRERLVKALGIYLLGDKHKTGSKVIQKRVEIALEHGWSLPAVAREELSFLFAGIVNATTSTFWILLQIFADPEILATVRQELDSVVEIEEGMRDKSKLRINDLKNGCPMLVAVYRECLRLGSDNYSTRLVKEDTMLADQYFLKKNSVIQIAGGVIHADKSIWGDNVESFNPYRFLGKDRWPQQQKQQQQQQQPSGVAAAKQIHPAAFRAFGGGKTLCPGRHFAMNEILAFVALIVLQFDMKAPGGGRIEVPRKNDGVLPVHILEPAKPVHVLISKRDGVGEDGMDIEFEM